MLENGKLPNEPETENLELKPGTENQKPKTDVLQ